MDNKILIEQSQHWEKSFSSKPEMFGSEPSHSAKIALENFKKNNVKHIIELGAGLGRDTIFFAKNSIKVTALDYSPTAVEIIKTEGKASTSFLQRKLQIGYNRAARIIDMMESEGIVSKANHVGKRDVLK